MLEIIDDINKYVLFENFFFVSFDVVNVFPNIDNKSGLLSGNEALTDSNFDVDSRHCFVDTLEMCLTCRNSKFYHQNSLQTDVQHRVLICLVPMLTLPWTSMTLLRISSILCLVFGKDLEIIFLYYGNMVPLPSLRF